MKNLIALLLISIFIIPLLAKDPASVAAQAPSSASTATTSVDTKDAEVKDYKGFKNYTEKEQSKLKTKPLTIENGPVKDKLKKQGIEFSPTDSSVYSKDLKRAAYSSPDKKGIAVLDGTTRIINILNPKGEIVRKIPFPEKLEGLIGFSDTRLFDFKGGFGDYDGGFFIYDLSGRLIKNVKDSGMVDAYMVSNNQKYFTVTGGLPGKEDFFILYDMNGNELWRRKTIISERPVIQFSLDDKFVLLKMTMSHKLYLFSVEEGKLISEENYEE